MSEPDVTGKTELPELNVDRRAGLDRRHRTRAEAGYTGLERRRGPGRRRTDNRRSAEEGEMNAAQFEFIMAVETFKKVNKKLYPTWTEILEVFNQLGYRKVEPRKLRLDNVPEAPLAKRVA